VYGFNRYQIIDQMRKCGPDYQGKNNDALTLIVIQYWYWLKTSGGQCMIDRYITHRNVDVYYPRWQDGGSSSQDVNTRWSNYEQSLIIHETGHIAHGGQIAQAITSYFGSLAADSSCTTLAAKIETDVPAIIATLTTLGQQYDAETRSGATQLISPNVYSD
jgi:predicted secreted Zn-dependent protease